MPIHNHLFSMINDTRSDIAKWSPTTGEIVVVDISDLLWIPKGKNITHVKIPGSFSCKVSNNIVVANTKIILPTDSLVIRPNVSSRIQKLEVCPRKTVTQKSRKKITTNNTIWIGPSVDNLSCDKAIFIDSPKSSPGDFDKPLRRDKPLRISQDKNENEDLIRTQVINLPDDRKIPEINNSVSSNNLWKPQEKQIDVFNNEFLPTPHPEKNLPSKQQAIHPPKPASLNSGLLQTSRTAMQPGLAHQYRFQNLYARSRLGNIYFCKHKGANEKYFAWILHRQYSFTNPATILAICALRHRYILSVKDVCLYKGHTTVFLRCSKVIPLRLYLGQTALTTEQKLYLVQAIIAAVEYAHAHQVTHGNLSFSNIVVDEQGCPKILGFGIKKTRPTCIPANGIDELKKQIHKPQRISYKNMQNDSLSVGYILYEIITGKSPLRKDTMNRLQRRSNLQDTSFPKHLQKEIPRPLQFICVKAIDSRKNYGYESLHELKNDINDLLNDQIHDSRWAIHSYRFKKWWGKHRDRANVYFIGFTIFLSLWLVPANLKVPDMLNPNAKTEEQRLVEIITDLQSSNKATCVVAIKDATRMGKSAQETLPYLRKLAYHTEEVIRNYAQKAIIAIELKTENPEKITSTNMLTMLRHSSRDARLSALEAVDNLKKIENEIIKELLDIASFDTSSYLREKAKSILDKTKLTSDNLQAFTKSLENRATLVKRLVLKKIIVAPVNKQLVIETVITFLSDHNVYNRQLALKYLKESIDNNNKWIQKLVPELRGNIAIEARQDIYEILGKITPIHPKNALYLTELLVEKNKQVNLYAQQSFSQIDIRHVGTTHHMMKAFRFAHYQAKEFILRGVADSEYRSINVLPMLKEAMNNHRTAVRKWAVICAGRMRSLAAPLIPELEALAKDQSISKDVETALEKIR